MYWDTAIETLDPIRLQELQLLRLRETLHRALKSPFYRERLTEAGVMPADLVSLADIQKIPFTTKDDLRARGKDMLTVPLTELVRLHASSGSTGQATIIYYTRADI